MHRLLIFVAIALAIGACGAGTAGETPSSGAATNLPPASRPADQGSTTDRPDLPAAAPWPATRIHPTLLPDPVSGQLLMVGGLSRMQR